MDNRPSFKQAEQRPTDQVELGDLIAFPDGDEWKRGIVYNSIAHPVTKEIIGFRLLPLETVGRNVKPGNSKYDTLEKDNDTLVRKAGGKPRVNKTIVYFNLKTFYNYDVVTRPDGSKDATPKPAVWVMDTYRGSTYHAELIERVQKLNAENKLYLDGEIPTKPIRILTSHFAKQIRFDDRAARAKTMAGLTEDNKTSGRTSLEAVARDTPVAPARKAAAKPVTVKATQYDVTLRDLVTVMTMGGERSGLTGLRGGANNDEQETQPIIDLATGEKTKTLTTLRDAWNYINKISPDLDPATIAKTVQQSTNMTLNGATKVTARLKELFAELDNVKTVDGQPQSDDPSLAYLIDQGKLIPSQP